MPMEVGDVDWLSTYWRRWLVCGWAVVHVWSLHADFCSCFQQSLARVGRWVGRWVGADLQVGVNERKIAMYVKKELKQITFCKVGSFNAIV